MAVILVKKTIVTVTILIKQGDKMSMDFELKRSKRKSISLIVKKDLSVIVRAPLRMANKEIEIFVNKHTEWIIKQKNKIGELYKEQEARKLSETEIVILKERAREVMPDKTAYFSKITGLNPNNVKITSAVTRWGSCSSRNNICYPYRIMLLPEDIIDYIVVHELCHIKEKNHSVRFYSLLQSFIPDYKDREKKLKYIQKSLV